MPTEISPSELREIVQRAQGGSEEDFRRLYDLFSRAIFNFVWRLIGSLEDAEDLTQETFLKVHSEIGNLRESGQFKFWLYRIARNEVYQRLRRSKRSPEISIDHGKIDYYSFLPDSSHDTNPEQQALSGELNQVVGKALTRMSPKYRDVFVLAVFHKMSYQEITKIVGRSLLSVKTDIYRARLMLKDDLKKYLKSRS